MVPFTKASACGNDFLIIDGLHAPADLYEFSRRICDRHNGVGADGVEWLFPAPDADIRVESEPGHTCFQQSPLDIAGGGNNSHFIAGTKHWRLDDGFQKNSPVQISCAGPRRKTFPPFQRTNCVPPGAWTFSGELALPAAMEATAEAHDPVPEDCVSPTPRS